MKRITGTIALSVLVLACAAGAEAAGPLTTVVTSLPLGTRAHHLVLNDAGNLAYVGTDLGLTIVDISNPAAPVKLGSVKAGDEVLGIAVQGLQVYLAAGSAGLVVVDVANPGAPVVVAKRKTGSAARDVALKGDVAYVATFGGELFLFDIADPDDPRQIKTIGLSGWKSPGGDASALARLNNYITAGNGKVTGVSVTGNSLFVVEVNYGRLFYYDVTNAANPIFKGTHYAPFTLQVAGDPDPDRDVVYMLSTYGATSGLYTVPISILRPSISTTYATCTACGFFRQPTTDYGGLTVSSNGKYVISIAGKRGVVQVLDVTDPSKITDAGSLPIPPHGITTLETMGVQSRGDFIYTAAGILGLQVFRYPHLSD